jgi:hypothetical protein
MKWIFGVVALIVAATVHGQSVIFEFGERQVSHQVAYSGVVPNTGFTGIAIVRTQTDMDSLWATLHGTLAGWKTVSPLRLSPKDEQFIVVAIPPEFTSYYLPAVASLVQTGPSHWRMEVAPISPFRGDMFGRPAQVLVVRTPRGPDNLDVWIKTQSGSVLASLKQANPTRGS